MLTELFPLLSLVIVIAMIVSGIMRLLRQPLIVGYILTGIILGPAFLHLIPDSTEFTAFSNIGIALLLFIIGLGLSTEVIRRLGKIVLVASIVQIGMTAAIAYALARGIGFTGTEALILGTGLTFSSTIIIIKLLNDKKEQGRMYAQIALGILLVQDIVATIALVVLAAGKDGGISTFDLGTLAIKGVLAAAALTFVSSQILPRLAKFLASSQEFLFLFALAWGFGIATLFEMIGFSIEVGALFAGVSLASLPYSQEMAARLKPLRDFFVVVFFIALGEELQVGDIGGIIGPVLLLTLVVIVIKPLLVLAAMGTMGYTKRTSFKTAITLTQVSEFSLIFVVLATTSGLVGQQLATILTMVAIITIAISTYLMKYDDELFLFLEHSLRFFERKTVQTEHNHTVSYPMVLFGYHKGGAEFVKSFTSLHKRYIVVDYNPDVIEELERKHIEYLYGDVTDLEIFEELNIQKTKLIVTTITDHDINVTLVRHVTKLNPNAIIICHSDNYDEAAELYHLGATYVMMPHMIGSEKISSFIRRKGLSKNEFIHYRDKHLMLLEQQRTEAEA